MRVSTAPAPGMPPSETHLLTVVGAAVASLVLGIAAVWGGFALWYQGPGGTFGKALCMAAWTVGCVAALGASWHGRAGLGIGLFVLIFAGLLFWWQRIPASNDRLWSDDVARMTNGTLEDGQLTLHNVRNFDWRSETDYTQRWETRSYDLDRLRSVDMIMSYWTVGAIAHMLISFGFDDGAQLAFSVEIRREKAETFSEVGGFFKEFELTVIAADERDVIRLRTNVRGEDDYLYRLRMPRSAMRSLLLGYLDEANRLVATPRFYNTITVNCTTLVYHMMKQIVGRLPLDYRLLLSGYLPEYVYKVRGLDMRYTLDELRARGRITERARQADRGADFSAQIRRGIAALGAQDLPAEPPAG